MKAKYELLVSGLKCFFGKHVLDFENETEHHCYCRKKYVRKPVPKMPKAAKKSLPVYNTPKPKKKVIRFPNCPTKDKISMSEKNAKLRADKERMRAYPCEWCPYWHLTHKKNKLKMH